MLFAGESLKFKEINLAAFVLYLHEVKGRVPTVLSDVLSEVFIVISGSNCLLAQ